MLVVASQLVLAAAPAAAQTASVSGWFEGKVESVSSKWAVISGIRFKIAGAILEDDIDRLRVGREVKVDFSLRGGVFRASYIDDRQDGINGIGLLSGTITAKTSNRITMGGATFVTRNATVEGDADYFVGGSVKVEFITRGSRLIAYNIDDN
jgi:hypothetical protein